MQLYPLLFTPIYKEKLWGGTKLATVLQKPIPTTAVGESWEISAVDKDISMVANGALQGKTLQELINTFSKDLLGRSVVDRFGNTFPILVKFIDAKLDLSIQLHPNDTLAKARHNSFGKTEMWYIMQADPKAKLIIGFKPGVTKAIYQKHLQENTLTDILHYESVATGDAFFINTGKIHAIGAGVLLAEIQQTSDITYRVYDFNRKDKDGKTRELHTDLALDAIDYKAKDDFKLSYAKKVNQENKMASSPYFVTNYLEVTTCLDLDFTSRDSFTIFMCVAGQLELKTSSYKMVLQTGQTVLLPACIKKVRLKATMAKLLEVYI